MTYQHIHNFSGVRFPDITVQILAITVQMEGALHRYIKRLNKGCQLP
jgi:hypothetical protein